MRRRKQPTARPGRVRASRRWARGSAPRDQTPTPTPWTPERCALAPFHPHALTPCTPAHPYARTPSFPHTLVLGGPCRLGSRSPGGRPCCERHSGGRWGGLGGAGVGWGGGGGGEPDLTRAGGGQSAETRHAQWPPEAGSPGSGLRYATHSGRAGEPLRAQLEGCSAAVRPRPRRQFCGFRHAGGGGRAR